MISHKFSSNTSSQGLSTIVKLLPIVAWPNYFYLEMNSFPNMSLQSIPACKGSLNGTVWHQLDRCTWGKVLVKLNN